MSVIVERVARRMRFEYVDSFGYPNGFSSWDDMDAQERALWLSMARSAIGMLRDPTEAMLLAGSNQLDCARELYCWQAMIDEALK